MIALYRPELGDAVEFLLRCSASAELHHPYVYPPSTYAAFAAYLQRLADGRHLGFLLRRLEDRSLVGVINLNELVRGGFHSAYLGFYGFVPFNGKGYMTEGLRLVLRYCFRTLRLHRLEANVQPGNLPSLALVRRCAFRHEGFSPHYLKINGRWRDHERFALTREDWAGKLDREFGNA
ncbi:MAG: hypothetical protein A2284_01000 [Deltaproteobacteria bacterium RIFOXYA12_FULL_61_11]|nr:MAG: hypothetical protein A2284_01000 [Deltaproteobacteria bacterium RIFOXYA12_FULL_61_11]